MVKDSDETPRKKRGNAGQMFVYGLLGLIIIGVSGFGVTSFGGGQTILARVGDSEVDAARYIRAMQSEMNAFAAQIGQPVTFQQAQALGLDRQVLQSVLAQAAMDNEAGRIGLSVGDAAVAKAIQETPAFQGTDGAFDRDAYRFVLERQGQTEAEFEADLRADIARQILAGGVVGGFTAPPSVTDAFFNWVAERRSMTMLRLTDAALTAPVPAPTDADLKAFYDANIDQFTAPEARRITYAAILPEDIAADQPLDEAALKAAYDERINEFVQPERRLVERLAYPSEAEAQAAKAKLDAGTSFDDLVAERGLTLDDIDMGDVAKADLGAAGDAVFALTEPGVVGPLQSEFGPALFRMNAILEGQNIAFEQARADLALEVQMDAARRAISDRVEEIDDLLASGATLEDLSKEQAMTLATVDFVPSETMPEGIAAYPKFREAATAVAEGDFPEAIVLDDGGVVALQLDEIVPPAPIPFDTARADVETAWRADQTARALAARAAEIVASTDALSTFGTVTVQADLSRDGFIDGAPPAALQTLFTLEAGKRAVVEDGRGFVAVVQLDAITPAKAETEEQIALRAAIAAQVEQAISQDALTLYSAALTQEAGISIDQAVLSALNTQIQ